MKSHRNFNTLVNMNFLFVIVPAFWPVPLVLGIRSYIKTLENLKPYFNDKN